MDEKSSWLEVITATIWSLPLDSLFLYKVSGPPSAVGPSHFSHCSCVLAHPHSLQRDHCDMKSPATVRFLFTCCKMGNWSNRKRHKTVDANLV